MDTDTRMVGYRVDEFGDVFPIHAWRVSNKEVVNFDSSDLEQMRSINVFHTMTIGVNFFEDRGLALAAAEVILAKLVINNSRELAALEDKHRRLVARIKELSRES